MAQIEIGQDQFVLEGREFRRLLECENILKAVDHTLSVHGKVDADTPLHQRIEAALVRKLTPADIHKPSDPQAVPALQRGEK